MTQGYDVAQICLNGHIVNDSVRNYPQHSKYFCDKCGAKTITSCQNCKFDTQGHYRVSGVLSLESSYSVPAFCYNCGNPYPWTELKIQTAHELVQEIENLSDEDKNILTQSIDDIVKDSPKTTLAATRFKKIISRTGKEVAGGLRTILIDIVSEMAKKSIWG